MIELNSGLLTMGKVTPWKYYAKGMPCLIAMLGTPCCRVRNASRLLARKNEKKHQQGWDDCDRENFYSFLPDSQLNEGYS